MAAPIREKLLTAMVAPKCMTSRTDSENREPSLAIPSSEMAAPTRETLRTDSDDPTFA
jgi:hypothetical protein